MILNYKKRKNTELFDSFKKIKELSLYNTQNYIPIYSRFFSLNHTNYNNINLNHNNYLYKILSYNDYNNSYDVLIVNDKNNTKTKKQIFIKLAPLLDPYKFLSGKYDIPDENMFNIPTIYDYNIKKEKSIVYNKINEINNSCYVEGFFYYLSSILFNKHNFINGIDFYGSFLSIKNNFIINVEKSRFVREKSKIPVEVTFEGGISTWSGLLDVALEGGFVIKPSNGWYSIVNKETGEVSDKKLRLKDTYTKEFWLPIITSQAFRTFIENKYRIAGGEMLGASFSNIDLDEEFTNASEV